MAGLFLIYGMKFFDDKGMWEMQNNESVIEVRLARESDIDRILELLVQVNMVHHNGRPDIFKGPATKYSREELIKTISTI